MLTITHVMWCRSFTIKTCALLAVLYFSLSVLIYCKSKPIHSDIMTLSDTLYSNTNNTKHSLYGNTTFMETMETILDPSLCSSTFTTIQLYKFPLLWDAQKTDENLRSTITSPTQLAVVLRSPSQCEKALSAAFARAKSVIVFLYVQISVRNLIGELP